MSSAVRVRYAPSPTGALHLGGLRTALYNYAFAQTHGGTFILRIEDTDRSRLVPGSVEALTAALKWCGVEPDEGPGEGGPYGPYVQSERLPQYAAAAERLLHSGHAYRCFCSVDRLDALRKAQAKRGRAPLYDRACSRLRASESNERAAAGEAHVIRLLVPDGTSLIEDAVRGSVSFSNSDVDDQVLLKSDGWPTYHLASVVDDNAMRISHVIRGQEWLPSTPKHTILYAALGWTPPLFAHLPILLNPDRSKLSKRQGDASVEDFRGAGFMASSLVHFVALLGWTPDSGKGGVAPAPEATAPAPDALLTLADLSAGNGFRLSSVHAADSIVSRSRLEFLNGEHIRAGMSALPEAPPAISVGGKGSHPPPGPLHVADTPVLAAVREYVVPHLTAAVSALHSPDHPPAPLPSVEVLNAYLLAQHERVRPLSDFLPLLIPLVLEQGGPAWGEWMCRPEAQAAGARILAKSKSAEGAAAAPEDALGGDCTARIVAPLEPALRAVEAAWADMDDESWNGAGKGDAAPLAAAKAACASVGTGPGALLLPLRFLLTGLDVGAGMGTTLRLVGRGRSLHRLRLALAK
jgi:glutamyl-tRNA synthetase